MQTTLGLVANVYNEANALPGWLETHLGFFDDVRVLHAGPQGQYSNDGTIEILEKWKIPHEFTSIDEGFGVVRTKAIRMSPCDWVMILDADERFFSVLRVLSCSGESTPHSEVDAILQTYDFRDLKTMIPNWENISRLGAKLQVKSQGSFDQGYQLRSTLTHQTNLQAVITVRRHWHDFSFRRPTQNWYTDPDWQMRLVKNSGDIYFESGTRMHERLVGALNVCRSDMELGPFFDHFHFSFKQLEMEQRAHDVAIYNAIHEGKQPPSREEFDSKLMP